MPMQAHRGGGGKATTHLQPTTRRKWAVCTTLRPLYSQQRDPLPVVHGWVGPDVGTENLVHTVYAIPTTNRKVIIVIKITLISVVCKYEYGLESS